MRYLLSNSNCHLGSASTCHFPDLCPVGMSHLLDYVYGKLLKDIIFDVYEKALEQDVYEQMEQEQKDQENAGDVGTRAALTLLHLADYFQYDALKRDCERHLWDS